MFNQIRSNEIGRIKNTSYIFVPFYCPVQFNELSIDEQWREKNQGNKYFLKYIVDKLKHNSANVCCRPYLMEDVVRDSLGIVKSNRLCTLETRQYAANNRPFSFYIVEILLFLFETKIGFLIYKIEHEKNDTYKHIASKNYHLKKIHSSPLYTTKEDGTKATLVLGDDTTNSLSLLTQYILKKTVNKNVDIFFNYTSEKERRCNILSHFHLKLEHKLCDKDNTDIENILFLLKRNYHHEWEPDFGSVYKETEYYQASPFIRWGISSEATVCLTISDIDTFFVGNSFYDNFHSYYLYEYILALHQKYALYYFLTNFKAESDLDELENNIADLADFRAKYVFQIISESETYQTVYSKQCKVFELETLFCDIDEQVNRVTQIKNAISERKQEEQEDKINHILALLAFFGIFSASNDVSELIESLDWIINRSMIPNVQKIAVAILWGISLTLLVRYFIANSKKHSKSKKRGK